VYIILKVSNDDGNSDIVSYSGTRKNINIKPVPFPSIQKFYSKEEAEKFIKTLPIEENFHYEISRRLQDEN